MTPFNTDDLAPETNPTYTKEEDQLLDRLENDRQWKYAKWGIFVMVMLYIVFLLTSCQKHVDPPVKPTTTSAEVIKQSGVVTVTVTIPQPLTVRYYVHVEIYFGTYTHGAYLYLLPGQTTATWKAEFDFNPTGVKILSEGEEKI